VRLAAPVVAVLPHKHSLLCHLLLTCIACWGRDTTLKKECEPRCMLACVGQRDCCIMKQALKHHHNKQHIFLTAKQT
jgi:hypothetical protein